MKTDILVTDAIIVCVVAATQKRENFLFSSFDC